MSSSDLPPGHRPCAKRRRQRRQPRGGTPSGYQPGAGPDLLRCRRGYLVQQACGPPSSPPRWSISRSAFRSCSWCSSKVSVRPIPEATRRLRARPIRGYMQNICLRLRSRSAASSAAAPCRLAPVSGCASSTVRTSSAARRPASRWSARSSRAGASSRPVGTSSACRSRPASRLLPRGAAFHPAGPTTRSARHLGLNDLGPG